MKYTESDLLYLSGKKFSNGYELRLTNNILLDRLHQTLQIVKGKNVLHIGCCDHIPLIEEKIKKNKWLHGLLDANCKRVIGIDINKDAVDYVNERKFAKEKVFCSDISKSGGLKCIPDIDYDYILLGEILEHVDNPVEFLSSLVSNVQELSCFKNVQYIITVPNAYALRKGINRKRIECINSDHRYWFTPYTIAKVMIRAGIVPTECYFASYGTGGNGVNIPSELVYKALEIIRGVPCKHNSYLGDSIIVIGNNDLNGG